MEKKKPYKFIAYELVQVIVRESALQTQLISTANEAVCRRYLRSDSENKHTHTQTVTHPL